MIKRAEEGPTQSKQVQLLVCKRQVATETGDENNRGRTSMTKEDREVRLAGEEKRTEEMKSALESIEDA